MGKYTFLYIPLCLYFNLVTLFLTLIASLFTFHYVSILMLFSLSNFCVLKQLYIPLCLYFN